MPKRLRLLHVVVAPILVWDDGERLSPGPQVQEGIVTDAMLDDFARSLRAQVADLAAKVAVTESDDETVAPPTD